MFFTGGHENFDDVTFMQRWQQNDFPTRHGAAGQAEPPACGTGARRLRHITQLLQDTRLSDQLCLLSCR